ncbi:MAG: OmpA family protein [Deltaproteobacteria bacterium]|jgi:OOP family OmpA-OmpF porin|nr:OmpA family protein [Deltaproteobacteria bacterium]
MRAIIVALALAALAFCIPGQASAQMDERTVHLSVLAGGIFPSGKMEIHNGAAYSLGIGYNFTKNFGLEIMGTVAPSLGDKWTAPNEYVEGDNDFLMGRLNVLWHFETGTNFTPYVNAGFGTARINVERGDDFDSLTYNAGLGFKYFFNETTALRFEANEIMYARKNHGESYYHSPTVQAGVTFQFPVGPGCVDPDGDGVCEPFDKCPGTPPGYRVDADGCPITVSITLDVKFDFDKAVVKPAYRSEVERAATFLNQHPGSTAVVEGHTDGRGTVAYNQNLSERRARAVRDYLVTQFGVAPGRVDAVGYGKSRPIATNDTDAGRAENRRVVGVFTGTDVDR